MGDNINTKLWWFFETWKKLSSILSRNSMENRKRNRKSQRSGCARVDILHKARKLTSQKCSWKDTPFNNVTSNGKILSDITEHLSGGYPLQRCYRTRLF